jgi:hypothetical protein
MPLVTRKVKAVTPSEHAEAIGRSGALWRCKPSATCLGRYRR